LSITNVGSNIIHQTFFFLFVEYISEKYSTLSEIVFVRGVVALYISSYLKSWKGEFQGLFNYS
jgi:hypothetical protein